MATFRFHYHLGILLPCNVIYHKVIPIVCLSTGCTPSQTLLAVIALQRGRSVHLEIVHPSMCGYVDLLCNKDLRKRGHNDGPENGYRGADNSEIDLDACNGKGSRVPPREVHGRQVVVPLSERGPQA